MNRVGSTGQGEAVMREKGEAGTKGNRTPIGRREDKHGKGKLGAEGTVGADGKITLLTKEARDQGEGDISGLGFSTHTSSALTAQ